MLGRGSLTILMQSSLEESSERQRLGKLRGDQIKQLKSTQHQHDRLQQKAQHMEKIFMFSSESHSLHDIINMCPSSNSTRSSNNQRNQEETFRKQPSHLFKAINIYCGIIGKHNIHMICSAQPDILLFHFCIPLTEAISKRVRKSFI